MAGNSKIPSAQEEALQEPTIDPAFLAATGVSEGPMAALKLLTSLLGQDAVLGMLSSKAKRALQYLSTPEAGGKVAHGIDMAAGDAARTANKGGQGMRRMFNPSLRNYAASRAMDKHYGNLSAEDFGMGVGGEPSMWKRMAKLLAESPQELDNMRYMATKQRMSELAKKIPIQVLESAE